MVKSNLHGHTKQIGYPESCIRKRNRGDTGASVREYAIRTACRISRAQNFIRKLSNCDGDRLLQYIPPTSCTLLRLSPVGCPLLSHAAAHFPSYMQLNQSGIWRPQFQSITIQISAGVSDIESFVKSLRKAGGRCPRVRGHILMEISAQGGLSQHSPTY